jgi:DNA polymerase III epsilon subunit
MRYVVFDLETTGLSPVSDAILEIGALVIEDGAITDQSFQRFVNPGFPIPYHITRINGINDAMVREARTIGKIMPEFLEFIRGASLVAHNASFDMGFIAANTRRLGLPMPASATCTVELSRRLFPRERRHNLDAVCERLNLRVEQRHRAMADVELTAQAFLRFQQMLEAPRAK